MKNSNMKTSLENTLFFIDSYLLPSYFFGITLFTLLSYYFLPILIENGRSIQTLKFKLTAKNKPTLKVKFKFILEKLHNTKISKKYFFIFYGVPLIMHLITNEFYNPCIFLLHPFRRFLETLIYSNNSLSFMTLLQFIHGMIYYCALFTCLRKDNLKNTSTLFIVSNILQSVAHFRVYALKKREFTHYYCEIFIHFCLFVANISSSMLFNLIYVMSFAYISCKTREKSQKIIKI